MAETKLEDAAIIVARRLAKDIEKDSENWMHFHFTAVRAVNDMIIAGYEITPFAKDDGTWHDREPDIAEPA